MFINKIARRIRHSLTGLVVVWLWSTPLQAQQAIVIDDFESGAGAWTRNDKLKAQDPDGGATLVDVMSTLPSSGGPAGSRGAALFTFKAAQGSWASASRLINGAQWAKIGAQRLTFWLNAGGEEEGVELVLRGRYRSADGSTREEAFKLPKPIRLDLRQWRKVVIPLSDFKSDRGLLPARMSGLYLIQFVQTGSWDSRFFMVDQMQVEGSGNPLPQVAEDPAPTAAPTAARPAPPSANAVKVSVDFLRTQGRILPSANVSVGSTYASIGGSGSPVWNSTQFRQAMATLKPRFMRIDAGALADLTDSSRPAFDFRRLQTLVRQARILRSEPIIAVTNPREWGLDTRGYAVFARDAAQATRGSGMGSRYFELATGANTTNDAQAVALYNRARAALKSVNKNYRVGGNTVASGRPNSLTPLLQGALGIDFLTVQFYGALTGTPSDSTLMNASRDIASLRQAAALLDKSRWRDAPLYITQSNLNSARAGSDPAPGDGRTVQMISAAWWANFLGSASRVADQIFHNDAINPEWGLLDEDARAYPAYYVLWLWN
ncbi:MAG TPA: hypothetical protein VNA16_07675, partial [Abditibacteriaceae bacterium]|nr:hypothetical protein [Abditibacteriaceae bacterium]